MSNTKTREIKTKFSIEGERNLKAALKENAAQAKELKSEMALLDAKFADATDSEEYLAEKSELLARQTANAQEKVDLYNGALESARQRQQQLAQQVEQSRQSLQEQEDALEAARTQYGDGSERVAKLTDELEYNRKAVENQEAQLSKANKAVLDYRTSANYAQASVEKMSAAVQENDKALENAAQNADNTSQNMDSLCGGLEELAGAFGIRVPDGVKKMVDAMGSADGSIGITSAGIVGAIGAIVTAAKALVDAMIEAAGTADDINTLSVQLGLTTDDIQELQYAASLVDVEINDLQDAMKNTINVMRGVQDGNKAYIEVMDRLGVRIKDNRGQLRDYNDVMYDLFMALSKERDETQKAMDAQLLFGESWRKLNPVLKDGGENLKKIRQEAHEAGAVIQKDGIDKLNGLNDALDRIKKQLKSGVMSAIAELLGAKSDDGGHVWRQGYASGTPVNPQSGAYTVGEYGPERVFLPKGSSVMNARDTASASAGTTNITLNVSVPNLETLNRIVQFYENYQITKRMG